MRDRAITPPQRRVLVAIVRLRESRRGRAPTLDEIAEELGLARSTVWQHVEGMFRAGLLDRVPGEARSIVVLCDLSGQGCDGPAVPTK